MAQPQPADRIIRFENLAYGMFIHWGPYSLIGRGEWVQDYERMPKNEYIKLADKFTAKDFDPFAIAKLAKDAGMKYICLTTRHHDGFSLYDTKGLCDFDAPHSAAGRDLVLEFVQGCRSEGIVPFFYHTTLDWYQESFKNDFNAYLDYLINSIEVLCTNYGEVGGFWFDGNWSKPDADWREDELYGTIRKHQPQAIIINNTGLEARGAIRHPEIDSVTYERGYPKRINREGMNKYLAAEMCEVLNKHWGIATNDFSYISPKDVIERLCACRKVGANFLLNVGPTGDGQIPEYESAILRKTGQWIGKSGDVYYKGKPSNIRTDNQDFALEADGKIYLFVHNLPMSGSFNVVSGSGGNLPRSFAGIDRKINSARWLDNDEKLGFCQDVSSELFTLNATAYHYGTDLVVRLAELS
jgi:alpha-L-fucosidase